MKAISAAQDTAKSFIYKAIDRRTQDRIERARLFDLLARGKVFDRIAN